MKTILFFMLLFTTSIACAATPDISIVNTVNEAIKLASTSIMPQALMWLGGFMGLQFVITNYSLLKGDGDLVAMFAKLLGLLLWFMFCFFVIQNGPSFIDSVGNGMLTKFAPNLPSPGSVITTTLSICTSLLIGIAATGTSIVGTGNSSIGTVLVTVLFIVFAIGMFMAIKLIMLQLELGLIVMMSPISFSFLGLNALKDQGISPFKSLISLIYRIILLGVVYAAFGKVIEAAGIQLDSFNWKNVGDWSSMIQIIFSMLCSFPVCAYLVWKSDSIAASLSSGSTNMGAGDVASAAAAGAALGAAAGAGGAAASDTATKGGQSMSDFMKSLNSSSVSNDSPKGAGGFEQKMVGTPPPPRPREPEMSLAQVNAERNRIRPGSNGAASSPPSSGSGNASPSSSSSPASNSSGSAGATKAGSTIDNLAPSGQLNDADFAKIVSDHSKIMGSNPGDLKSAGEAPSNPTQFDSGSGSSAGIGGATSATDQKLDKLMESMAQPNKPGFKDRLANANDHVAKEQAATHVSINTHHTD